MFAQTSHHHIPQDQQRANRQRRAEWDRVSGEILVKAYEQRGMFGVRGQLVICGIQWKSGEVVNKHGHEVTVRTRCGTPGCVVCSREHAGKDRRDLQQRFNLVEDRDNRTVVVTISPQYPSDTSLTVQARWMEAKLAQLGKVRENGTRGTSLLAGGHLRVEMEPDLHIHGLDIGVEQLSDAEIERLRAGYSELFKFGTVKADVRISRLDPTRGGLEGAITYATKGVGQHPHHPVYTRWSAAKMRQFLDILWDPSIQLRARTYGCLRRSSGQTKTKTATKTALTPEEKTEEDARVLAERTAKLAAKAQALSVPRSLMDVAHTQLRRAQWRLGMGQRAYDGAEVDIAGSSLCWELDTRYNDPRRLREISLLLGSERAQQMYN